MNVLDWLRVREYQHNLEACEKALAVADREIARLSPEELSSSADKVSEVARARLELLLRRQELAAQLPHAH